MKKQTLFLLLFLFGNMLSFAQAPTGLNGTGFRTTIHLKWNEYTLFQPVGYNIYRSTASGSFGAPVRRIGVYNDYTDYGLSPNTTYFYKISAFDAAGNESALTSQITVSTNNTNYLKVASLDLLIPIYLGGMEPGEPNQIRQSLEFARQFYFRNTKGQLNLKFHFMEIPGYPPPNGDGVGDFGTIGTDLHNRGILDNQYDAIHVEAYQTYGYWGGAQWLGQTAGSMAHQPAYYYNPNNHYTTGDAWVFVHEFGHSLDGIIAGGSGYPDMIFNHFPWAFPLPAGIASFDAGTDYDGMALVLRLFDHHLDYAAPWDGYIEATDSDGDKLANDDDRLPMDEADFGSSPFTDDSDLDGLTDSKEFYAGIYSSSNPNVADTDGDGTPDGTDPYPISNFRPTLQKTTAAVTINGTMATGEGWQPLVSNPFYSLSAGATMSASATWDDTYLYFAFQSNTPLKYYLYMDGSGEDGIFASPIRFAGGNYNDINDAAFGDSYYETSAIIIRSDVSQVFLKNSPVAGSQISTVNAGGIYTTEVRIPHNLGPGFGYTYTPPTAPVVTSQTYVTGDILGINLVALPLTNAVGYETEDWRASSMISMNEPFHFYDMALTGGTAPPANYCTSISNFPWEDWVANVKLGSFQNASGKSPYSDFTNLTANLNTGTTSVELTTGFSYFTWDEYWRVWIDLNHDGDFTDAGETVYEGVKSKPANGTATAILMGSLNIPASALSGPTRMRVSMKRNAYASPCETLPFGEVEDYTVNISSGPTQLANLQIPNYEVIPGSGSPCYTNPGQNFAHFGGLVLNSGAASAGAFTFKGWFSKDQQISANDVLWQGFSFTGLTPNNVVSWSFTNAVPASLVPGLYYVILQADADNSVAETNETDNLSAVQVWIGAPDFTVSSVAGVPASTNAGGSLTLAVQAKNLASFSLNELPGNLSVGIYLSSNNQFSSLDDVQIGTAQIAFNQFSNAPQYLNGVATVNAPAAIPPGTVAGNYFIFIVLNEVCEQSIVNNVSNAMPIQITVGGGPTTYCPSYSSFPWEDWIAKVELSNLSNVSAKSAYSDFTSQVANLTAGQSYPIKLTTGFSYFTWNEYWRVWIDFNHDGIFSTPNEVVQQQILTAPPAGTGTASVSGSINIPSWAPAGNTRMRVSMKRGSFAAACESLPFGEVEDYTVSIGGGSGPCTISAQVSDISCNGDYATATILVTAQNGGSGWVAGVGTPGGPVYVTGQYGVPKTASFYKGSGNTAYVSIFDSNASGCTTNVVLDCPTTGDYCESQSDAPWHDWIARVKLNSLDNQSSKSTYSEFTALSTTLQKWQSYPVTLTAGFSWQTFNEYWRVWIDYNQDGVFSTPDEVVQQQMLTAPANGTQTASVTGSINVPQGALTGSTRMRVSMKRGGYATACENFTNGEVEDYTIIIANSLSGSDSDERASNLHFEAMAGVLSVDLYGAYHQPDGVVEVVFEKSTDGENFLPLATLSGEVSDAVKATDNEPIEGFNYYQMRLHLTGGEVKTSPVKVISFVPVPDFTVFPNPATTVAHLNLEKLLGKRVQIKMLSPQGVLVKNIVLDEVESELLDVPLNGLPSGTYFLWLETPGRRAVSRTLVVEREF